MITKEGVFRAPRLRTNKILKKYAHLFSGDVINVSGSSDSDKNSSFFQYYLGDYDSGKRYKDYFVSASTYTVSNYPGDNTKYSIEYEDAISLDLEIKIPEKLVGKYSTVFCHTVFEHIFDIFTAFDSLCALSNDIVIFVVPQSQKIHDYNRGYEDYWRFTPFSIDRLFRQHDMKVLHREVSYGFSESTYLFYIASKQPHKWSQHFSEVVDVSGFVNHY